MSKRRIETPYRFFLRVAGYSYDPGKETRENGRRRCARALADAEQRGTAAGFTVEWGEDEAADRSFLDQEDYSEDDREAAAFYYCIVHGPDGAPLASLWSIHADTRDMRPFRDYQRVVRAELFIEAFGALEYKARAEREEAAR